MLTQGVTANRDLQEKLPDRWLVYLFVVTCTITIGTKFMR